MKLSIIVPVYNTGKYLRKCIDSILAQTLTDFELILVNDGSTDDSPSICDEYAKKDPRIKVIHKENGGQADARNVGLDIAKGEYIGFVDSDDYIEPNMYEDLYTSAIDNHAEITVSKIYFGEKKEFNEKKTPAIHIADSRSLLRNYSEYKYKLNYSVCNKIYLRSIFDNIRFPTKKLYEDAYIQLDIVQQSKQIVFIDHDYYHYISRSESTVTSKYTLKKACFVLDYKNNHLKFFIDNRITSQIDFMYEEYVDAFIPNYIFVHFKEKKSISEFKQYKDQAVSRIPTVLKNKRICKLKKAAYILLFISPKVARKLCTKYFPELKLG